jgi:DNA-binding MarR family transcriptional regulator
MSDASERNPPGVGRASECDLLGIASEDKALHLSGRPRPCSFGLSATVGGVMSSYAFNTGGGRMSKASDDKPIFAPLPARAMVDMRLTERHLRTLAVVAAHDRFSKNGVGCWASHERLAAMIGCDYSRLSTNLRELGEWGYIEKSPHPLNKRLRVYRVIYSASDGEVMKSVAAKVPADKVPNTTLPSGNVCRADSLPDGKTDHADSLPSGTELRASSTT